MGESKEKRVHRYKEAEERLEVALDDPTLSHDVRKNVAWKIYLCRLIQVWIWRGER